MADTNNGVVPTLPRYMCVDRESNTICMHVPFTGHVRKTESHVATNRGISSKTLHLCDQISRECEQVFLEPIP